MSQKIQVTSQKQLYTIVDLEMLKRVSSNVGRERLILELDKALEWSQKKNKSGRTEKGWNQFIKNWLNKIEVEAVSKNQAWAGLPEWLTRPMQRIADTFGASFYTRERMKLIETALITLDRNEVNKIVDHFIESFRKPPVPQDFREAAKREKHHRFKHTVKQVEKEIQIDYSSMGKELERRGAKSLWEAIRKKRE